MTQSEIDHYVGRGSCQGHFPRCAACSTGQGNYSGYMKETGERVAMARDYWGVSFRKVGDKVLIDRQNGIGWAA